MLTHTTNKDTRAIEAILDFQNRQYLYPLVYEPELPLTKRGEGAQLIERCDDIIKSTNDNRLYRILELTNKLKVLLISDPMTDKSAAAMDVNIGYLDDPNELPGLAHLCQCMLPRESKKYALNDYSMYISFNKGRSGGSTHMDHTTYYFDIHTNKLWGALDHFAQFFIEPILSEDRIEEEVMAIEWEYMNNLQNNVYIYDHLDNSKDLESVKFKFGLGNKHTLDTVPKQKGINVWERLLEFYEVHYSADIMSLCVLSKENLNELEKMVVDIFCKIPNKNIQPQKWNYNLFHQDHCGHTWYTVPAQNTRALLITFPISLARFFDTFSEEYKCRPTKYISYFLEREGENTLLTCLKKLDLCKSIVCGERAKARGYMFYDIRLNLTENGLKHTESIIYQVFHHIWLMQQENSMEWIFDVHIIDATKNINICRGC
ncbi:PREDICTED: insulin-degrading enzyme-like [Dinoponera quadriceps]|uniref:Insulin-degrading enzyme-like n=1 Tax=Dinoponera quadriceps TaxID=609295 RepID=A0A6P3Y7U8_DINQU|nr:PREDICTED: insulin-degrading enzyme-like [Dinoponera quadriceps]